MRISDWSSDVCTSDLAKINVGGTTVDRHRLRLHQQQQALDAAGPANRRGRTATELLDQTIVAAAREHRTLRTERGGRPLEHGTGVVVDAAHPPAVDPVRQIGRASCRERVCQYV